MNVGPSSCQSCCGIVPTAWGRKILPFNPPHPPFKFSLWQWFPQLTMDSEVSHLKNLSPGWVVDLTLLEYTLNECLNSKGFFLRKLLMTEPLVLIWWWPLPVGLAGSGGSTLPQMVLADLESLLLLFLLFPLCLASPVPALGQTGEGSLSHRDSRGSFVGSTPCLPSHLITASCSCVLQVTSQGQRHGKSCWVSL